MQATTSKVWLITGTSRGLGRAFTEAALEAGHQVVATARNPQQLGTIVRKYGGRVRAVALDLTNEAQAQHVIHTAIETFGGLDVLVNNAAMEMCAPWKTPRSPIFALRSRRISSTSLL